jgi:hypothetical protein
MECNTPINKQGFQMKMQEMVRITFMLFAVGLLASKAQAIPLATDITFDIPPEYFATQAADVSPNDNEALINAAFQGVGDPFTLLDKTDDPGPGTLFNDVTFELTANGIPGDPEGDYTWDLTWAGTGLPLLTDFVFVTKGGTNAYAYYFADVLFPADDLDGGGTFQITYTNTGGKIPELSHASAYARTDGKVPPIVVPVPATLFLLGIGLVGLAGSRRRNT